MIHGAGQNATPRYGARERISCTWCGASVVAVFRRYNPADAIGGGFWDCSACVCGEPQNIAIGMRGLAELRKPENGGRL